MQKSIVVINIWGHNVVTARNILINMRRNLITQTGF